VSETEIPFDYLVIGVGAQNSTFGIKGVGEHACFLKEVWDASKIRTRIMVLALPTPHLNPRTSFLPRLLDRY
jgi:NADH dehydrogenase FAD-containing subunit